MLNISKDHIGGLVFLLFSIVYGYYARQIALMPGDELQTFNSQTLPNTLAIFGVILSVALLVTAKKGAENRLNLMGYQFFLLGKLLLLIVLFAFSLQWFGFLLSTILFLVAGFWLLGETSLKRMLLVAVPFAVCSWAILSQLLDIYLAPGQFFTMFMGD